MKKILLFSTILFLSLTAKAGNYYWVNGTGNWSDYAAHWAISSGGSVFHVQPPTPSDNVYFDANSFTSAGDTLYIDSTLINCKDLDFSGAVNSPVIRNTLGSSSIGIYGSFIIHGNVQWNLAGGLLFYSSSPGNVINTSGATLGYLNVFDTVYSSFNFSGTGSWSLLSDIVIGSVHNSTLGAGFEIYNGTLFTNGHAITCGNFRLTNPGNAFFNTSAITCDRWDLSYFHNLIADSTTIVCQSDFNAGINSRYNNVTANSCSEGDSCTFNDINASSFDLINHSSCHNVTLQNNISSSSNNTFNKLTVASPSFSISGNNSFDTLIFSNPGMTINLSNTQTVISLMQADGNCSGLTLITSSTNGIISKTSGAITLNYVMLQNITGTGGAVFTANNSVNNGNVTGITINAPAPGNLYWVGGTGNWNDVAHWATSSGGAGGSCVPSPVDNVYFDVNSFLSAGDTVYFNGNEYCNTFDASAATNNPVFKGNISLNIYGSFIIHGNVQWNSAGGLLFYSSSPGNVINTSGATLGYLNVFDTVYSSFNFSGTGSWSLLSDIVIGSVHNSTLGAGFEIYNGTLFTNGHAITCGNFRLTNPGNAFFNTSAITCDRWDLSYFHNLIADSTTIVCQSDFNAGINSRYNNVTANSCSEGDSCTFNDINASSFDLINHSSCHNVTLQNNISSSSNNTFNKLTVASPSFSISGNNSFDTLIFSNPGMTINLSNTQTVISLMQADGNCSGLTLITSSTNGIISKTSGAITLNYVMLQNITGTGGAVFTANNSVNNGNVTGITINAPAPGNLYWVGGTGNWNDVAHWATSSGGAGGSCVPSPVDNVYFDVNSFLSAGDTVYFNGNEYCNTFDASAATNNPVFKGNISLNIYGSFIIHGNVQWNSAGGLLFYSSSPGNVINTSGATLGYLNVFDTVYSSFNFSGTGSWSLLSDIVIGSVHNSTLGAGFEIYNGTLFTNGHAITCGNFRLTNPGNAFFNTSAITCDRWDLSYFHNLIADSTTIVCQSDFNAGINSRYNNVTANSCSEGDSCTFNDINASSFDLINHSSCHNVTLQNNISSSSNNTFNKLTVASPSFSLSGNNSFDTLIFNNPGMTINLSNTQTITGLIIINSDPGFPTSLHGPATINYPDTLCTDFIYLQNINATGGQFFAGIHSVDLGGNTGWQFSSCSPVFSNVWPGDANYDLVVDNFDLLYIGVAYGDTGFVRVGASNAFTPQPCQDWFYQFINGTNVKKADSDGNGIVDAADTTAVSLNYGLTHPFRIPFHDETNAVGTELSFQVPPGTVTPGTVVNIPIMLGTSVNPANNVYGIAFTINYDIGLVQPGSLNIDFTGSWIESTNNHLSLVKDFPSAGKCDVAFTRINKTDISGTGQIGTLTFTVPANAYGYLNLSFSKIKLISHNEIDIPVSVHTDSINTFISEISDNHLSIYPNPSSGKLHVQFINKDHNKCLVTIFDPKGQVVYSEFTSNDTYDINTKDYVSGIYFMVIRNTESGRSFEGKILVE